MTRRPWILLAPVVLLAFAVPARADDDDDAVKEEIKTLKAANLDTTTKALVSTIKKRTISEETRGKVAGLIKMLGADEFDDREKASEELIEMGSAARPQLVVALKDPDLETRKRARKALDKIGPPSAEADLLVAITTVLTHRKPEGVTELILNYLPSIEEVETAERVAKSLALVTKDKAGKVHPVLIKALTDKKYPVKRWAAASALARSAMKDQRDNVLKVLDDEDVGVARRVAQALTTEAKNKEGVPGLIKTLASDSAVDRDAAEDLLTAIAGALAEVDQKLSDKAPLQPESLDSPKNRQRWKQEWEAWWKEASAKVDLKKINFEEAAFNFTLVGVYGYTDKRRYTGKLMELDKAGKVKWEMEELNYPVYASKVRRDRVLVCEYNANKVVEYDVKTKKVFFTKQLNTQPLFCERLPNGNTFIVTRNEMMEIDGKGTTVRNVARTGYDIVTGGRHKNGTYTLVTNNGTIIRYDKDFKQTGTTSTNRYLSYTTGLKCAYLPTGGLVLPDYGSRSIREYDKDGKEGATLANINYPTAVSKLPNGNYLYLARSGTQGMVEITKEGKAVSTKVIPGNDKGGRMTPLFMERK